MYLATILAICSTLLLAANAQQCPNSVATCSPDPCDNNSQCLRFLNAECQVNRCNGVCTANFFFRGRNVTDRCGVETCDTRDCGPNRQCMEEVFPPTCPEGRPISRCRQRLRTRCIRRPRPMTCEDIDCSEGMVCLLRERVSRPPVVRCVPAPVTTVPPTTAAPSTNPPMTSTSTPFTITPFTDAPSTNPPPQTSCNQINCTTGQVCLEIPANITGSPFVGCLPEFALSCESLSCLDSHDCLVQTYPGEDITLASCVPVQILDFFMPNTCANLSCAGEDVGCLETTHPSFGTAANCVPGFNIVVAVSRHLLTLLVDPSTSTPPTASTSSPITTIFTSGSPIVVSSTSPTEDPACNIDCASFGQTCQVVDGLAQCAPSATCDQVVCSSGLVCVEFPPNVIDSIPNALALCLPLFGENCETLSCPDSLLCVFHTIPDRDNISLAQCLPIETTNSFEQQTCEMFPVLTLKQHVFSVVILTLVLLQCV